MHRVLPEPLDPTKRKRQETPLMSFEANSTLIRMCTYLYTHDIHKKIYIFICEFVYTYIYIHTYIYIQKYVYISSETPTFGIPVPVETIHPNS